MTCLPRCYGFGAATGRLPASMSVPQSQERSLWPLAWPGSVRKARVLGPEVAVITLHVRVASHVSRSRRRQWQQVGAKRGLVGGPVSPKGSPGFSRSRSIPRRSKEELFEWAGDRCCDHYAKDSQRRPGLINRAADYGLPLQGAPFMATSKGVTFPLLPVCKGGHVVGRARFQSVSPLHAGPGPSVVRSYARPHADGDQPVSAAVRTPYRSYHRGRSRYPVVREQ